MPRRCPNGLMRCHNCGRLCLTESTIYSRYRRLFTDGRKVFVSSVDGKICIDCYRRHRLSRDFNAGEGFSSYHYVRKR